MEALYVLLGAALALGGGLITFHLESYYSNLAEESRLLFEIEKALLDLGAVDSQLKKFDPESKDLTELSKYYSNKAEHAALIEKLSLCAIRITSRKYRDLAIRVTKIALDDHLRTERNRSVLLEQVQFALNSKLIKKYNKAMQDSPDVF